MLLLKEARRLSTDIDIIIEPGMDIIEYIHKTSEIFPFVRYEEQHRKRAGNIEKRHFKFFYDSPVSGKEFYILLDVLYEKNLYSKLIECEIKNELVLSEGKNETVTVPSVDCILGDKLTAFAPHTTGIIINTDKDMEVMKQMYDICELIDVISDFDEVKAAYHKISEAEIKYRNLTITPADALNDTLMAASCITSRGKINKNDYPFYVKGIRKLKGHIFSERYSPEVAAVRNAKIMYLSAALLENIEYEKVEDVNIYTEVNLATEEFKPFKYLKKVDPEAYAYVVKTEKILSEGRRVEV